MGATILLAVHSPLYELSRLFFVVFLVKGTWRVLKHIPRVFMREQESERELMLRERERESIVTHFF